MNKLTQDQSEQQIKQKFELQAGQEVIDFAMTMLQLEEALENVRVGKPNDTEDIEYHIDYLKMLSIDIALHKPELLKMPIQEALKDDSVKTALKQVSSESLEDFLESIEQLNLVRGLHA